MRSRETPSVLIVQPDAEDPPELLGQALEREGFAVRVVRPFAGDVVPTTLEEDALVVLGGDMGAGDLAAHPWLADVMALLRHAVAEDSPTLGVCLGGQLLAASLGGTVERGAAGLEAGTVLVTARAEAGSDALLAGLPWPLRMITMHRDAITRLPHGAVWLADSEPYPHQVFRAGASAWGVQFHPEVSSTTYADWAASGGEQGEALRRVEAGVAETARHDGEIRAGAAALASSFAAIVRDAARR